MLTDFPTKKDYNPGGYKSFSFTPTQAVTSYPIIAQARALVAMVFAAGNDWLQGYATTETLSYSEEAVFDESGAGVYYSLTVAGFVPGDKPELIDLMAQMDKQRFIVSIDDTAGIQRLVGSPSMPLDFSAAFGSGAIRTDQKGFNFKFTGASTYRSPVYQV